MSKKKYALAMVILGAALVLVFSLAQLMHQHPHDVGQEVDGGDEVLADGTVVLRTWIRSYKTLDK